MFLVPFVTILDVGTAYVPTNVAPASVDVVDEIQAQPDDDTVRRRWGPNLNGGQNGPNGCGNLPLGFGCDFSTNSDSNPSGYRCNSNPGYWSSDKAEWCCTNRGICMDNNYGYGSQGHNGWYWPGLAGPARPAPIGVLMDDNGPVNGRRLEEAELGAQEESLQAPEPEERRRWGPNLHHGCGNLPLGFGCDFSTNSETGYECNSDPAHWTSDKAQWCCSERGICLDNNNYGYGGDNGWYWKGLAGPARPLPIGVLVDDNGNPVSNGGSRMPGQAFDPRG